MDSGATDPLAQVIADLVEAYPGREQQITQLASLLPAKFPNFLYIHDAFSIDATRSLLLSTLSSLSNLENVTPLTYVKVDCVACFSPRILYDTVLNGLLSWNPAWDDGYRVFNIEGVDTRWNDSLDSFLHGLRQAPALLNAREDGIVESSSDGNANRKIIIVFDRAENLRNNIPELLVPLTRLQELTGRNISTVFLSDVEWEHVNISSGNIVDPFRINVDPPSKQEIILNIIKRFPSHSLSTSSSISCFHPSLRGLFAHFVETVYDVCSPFTNDPKELGYIVGAQWPAFASPVLEDWRQQEEGPYDAPSEDGRFRLIRLFTPSLTTAIESLYPRSISLKEWREVSAPPAGFRLSQSMGHAFPSPKIVTPGISMFPQLSRLSKFIILASFLASTNPAKTDVRMFVRGPDERTRHRKRGGGTRKVKQGTVAKVPQRLLGPTAFPYDRLVAILGALMMEYDDHEDKLGLFIDASGVDAENGVYRVQTAAVIQELVSMRLLHRTTTSEKIEAPMFRCGITHEHAMAIAREMSIPLSELVWEQT